MLGLAGAVWLWTATAGGPLPKLDLAIDTDGGIGAQAWPAVLGDSPCPVSFGPARLSIDPAWIVVELPPPLEGARVLAAAELVACLARKKETTALPRSAP